MPQNQPQTFQLNLTEQHLGVISAALSELPYKHAAPVINSINEQVQRMFTQEQISQPEPPTS